MVKEHLASWQEEWGDEFAYIVTEFATENTGTGEGSIYLGKREHQYIIDYLASKGYLELGTSEKGSLKIKILPKAVPTVKLKTLELIARDLKDRFTGTDIIALLKEAGVNPQLIIYPQSKWLMFYGVFKELALSKDKKDRELLFKIIADALHPLNFTGNTGLSDELQEKFNKYLEYDGLVIAYSDTAKKYGIFESESGLSKEDEFQLLNEDLFIQEQGELEFLRLPENKERAATLREAYRAFINIVQLFCRNPSVPTTELNDAYVECKSLITSTVSKLDLYNFNKIYRLATYSLPFVTLFSAEKQHQQNGKILDWSAIRPEMYATYSDIEEIYRKAHSTGVTQEPDAKKILAEVSSLVTKTREQNKKLAAQAAEKVRAAGEERVLKVEISKMPDIKIRGEEVPVHRPVKTTLRGKIIEFDETRSSIVIDGKPYQLPPAQNEDSLARVMFGHQVGEFVDWSMIYSEMTGVDPQETNIENTKNMKMVRDTMNRLNGRLQEVLNTKDALLAWKNKSICRNY